MNYLYRVLQVPRELFRRFFFYRVPFFCLAPVGAGHVDPDDLQGRPRRRRRQVPVAGAPVRQNRRGRRGGPGAFPFGFWKLDFAFYRVLPSFVVSILCSTFLFSIPLFFFFTLRVRV